MLDVHPPHEAAHTWKDFLIHIATIVVGLLIAVGLEQTVEFFHHRHLTHRVHLQLAQELELNEESLRRNTFSVQLHEKHIIADLDILTRLHNHALKPTDRFITLRPYYLFTDAAWTSLHASGDAGFLSIEELEQYAPAYLQAEHYNQSMIESNLALGHAAILLRTSPEGRYLPSSDEHRSTTGADDRDGLSGEAAAEVAYARYAPGPDQLNRLSAPQIDRLEQALQATLYDDGRFIIICNNLKASYRDLAVIEDQHK
jgi:hypothetical protein